MPIRFLLAYLGVDYEDKLYALKQPPHSRDVWFAEKHSLDLDFPNVRLTVASIWKFCHNETHSLH